MKQNLKTVAVILIASICLAGCFSTSYLQQNKFMLHVNMPKESKTLRNAIVLQLEDPSITPQFANNSFVYRISNTQYETDYYNIFFIPAFQQVKQLLANYLSRSPYISHVVDAPSVIKAQYVLSPNIISLYADYRDRNNPTGVVTIEFNLYKHLSGKYYSVLHKTFTEATPLQQKDSYSLVNAWNTGLQKIFKRMSAQLNNAMKH